MTRLVEVAVPLPLQDAYTYEVPEALAEIARPGARVEVPFGRRSLVGYVIGTPKSTGVAKLKPIDRVLDDPPLLTPALLDLARWIAAYYACSFGEALRAVLPGGVDRKRGAPRGRRVEPGAGALLEASPPAALNVWQQAAFDRIAARVDAGGFEAFLLHGVTGSGKTEVYLHAIRHALASGHSPSSSSGDRAHPQAADRFRSRLGAEVGILHSGMTNAERHDVMVAAAGGEIQVVLGARSAVFAPFRNLGSWWWTRSRSRPTSKARNLAITPAPWRSCAPAGRRRGSARIRHPEPESYHNTRIGKHVLLEIPERVDSRPLPQVHLVDMRDPEERGAILSRRSSTRWPGGSTGASRASCSSTAAGTRTTCSASAVADRPLSVLRHLAHLPRHRPPAALPLLQPHAAGAGGVPNVRQPGPSVRGIGTQQLEQVLHGLLPRARVVRMDLDTTAGAGRTGRSSRTSGGASSTSSWAPRWWPKDTTSRV